MAKEFLGSVTEAGFSSGNARLIGLRRYPFVLIIRKKLDIQKFYSKIGFAIEEKQNKLVKCVGHCSKGGG